MICGGPGNDRILGGSHPSRLKRDDPSVLIGGPGNDYIDGGFDDDFIVGDNANLSGDAIGHVGKDFLEGEFGDDHVVGDNYSNFDARGGVHDKIRGQKGDDCFVGDSEVTGDGTATGGGNDHFEGSSDCDFEVGDSYSPHGTAIGGGDDEINAGPGRRLRSSATATRRPGSPEGSGEDQLHSLWGNDIAYGDNYAASPAGRDLRRRPRLHRRLRPATTTCSGARPTTPATAARTTTPRTSASTCSRSRRPDLVPRLLRIPPKAPKTR